MTPATDAAREAIAQLVYDVSPATFEDRVDGTCFMPWAQAKGDGAPHVRHAYEAADRILALTEAASQPREGDDNPWREAVIDALVVGHIYQAKHDDAPRQALHDLLAWEVEIALDPRVSERAAALTQRPPEQAGAVPAVDNEHLAQIVARALANRRGIHLNKSIEPWMDDARIAVAALTAAPTPPDVGSGSDGAGERYRHVKRGTVYEVIGQGVLQCSANPALDAAPVVIYRGEDGELWVRGVDEFHDGRFEPLATQTGDGGRS